MNKHMKHFPLTLIAISVLSFASFANASAVATPDPITAQINENKPLSVNDLDWGDETKKIKKKVKEPTLLQSQDSQFKTYIYGINVDKTSDNATELRINFNGFPTVPKAKKTENPSQLFLNFGEVGVELQKQIHSVATEQIKSFNLERNQNNEVVLTVNLTDNFGRFTTKKDDGNFVLKIYPSLLKGVVEQDSIVTASNGLKAIDFNRTKGGEDQVILDLAKANTPVIIDQKDSKLFIRFKGHKIPNKLLGSKSFNDVKAVVSQVSIYNEGFNGVIELDINNHYKYSAYQVDNKLTLNVATKVGSQSAKTSKNITATAYTGRPISLDLQNADIRKILQVLANYTDSNIVVSDNVTGDISVRLQDVPWDQALAIILKTKGLSQRKDGKVIWVAPSSELAKYEEDEAKAYANSVTLAPLVTAFVQLNYATASSVVDLIRMQDTNQSKTVPTNLTAQQVEVNGLSNSLLSPRGSVAYDERTSTIIINDTAQKVADIKRVIEQIDIPVRQVLVEARIVRATTNFARNIGVKWAIAKDGSNPINSNLTNLYENSNYYKNLGSSGSSDSSSSSSSSTENNVAIDLGQNLGSGLAFGLINTTDQLLGLELSALQSDGQGEVLSSPKVMTGDKQQANIRSGLRIPYQTTSENNGTTTTFQDAVLELIVTPSITPDGTVQMNLVINKDSLGQLTDAGYAIDTNQLTTNVLVDDGETVVLGGLYEESNIQGVEKVPFLGDIPVMGNLFKSKNKTTQKQELLIFITPKIVKKNK